MSKNTTEREQLFVDISVVHRHCLTAHTGHTTPYTPHYTLHSTLHPTLHTTPYTPHYTPHYTLHSTLHPTPYTLHSTPHPTLHPTLSGHYLLSTTFTSFFLGFGEMQDEQTAVDFLFPMWEGTREMWEMWSSPWDHITILPDPGFENPITLPDSWCPSPSCRQCS